MPNSYNYSKANPIMKWDPDGHMSKLAQGILGGFSIALGVIAMVTGFGSAPGWGMLSMGTDYLSNFLAMTLGIKDGSFNFKSTESGLMRS